MKSKHNEKVFGVRTEFTTLGTLAFSIFLPSKEQHHSLFPRKSFLISFSMFVPKSNTGDDTESCTSCLRAGLTWFSSQSMLLSQCFNK